MKKYIVSTLLLSLTFSTLASSATSTNFVVSTLPDIISNKDSSNIVDLKKTESRNMVVKPIAKVNPSIPSNSHVKVTPMTSSGNAKLANNIFVKPMVKVIPSNSPIGANDVIGRWKTDISMVDHSHPLYFDVQATPENTLTTTFSFSGMDSNTLGMAKENSNIFDFKSANVHFFLPSSGMKFEGHLMSDDKITGEVDWMGITQTVSFTKTKIPSIASEGKKQNKKTPLSIAILLFDGVDVLDWAGPLEVFQNAHAFTTFTVAESMKAYDGGSYQVYPTYTFDNMPNADILVIPGGAVGKLFHRKNVMDWIVTTSNSADVTMSVCNAATILGRLDILNGMTATTHTSWMKWLEKQSQQHAFAVDSEARFVDNGSIITTAGVSSGIDGALHLVAKLKGLAHAKMTARMIEYDWRPQNPSQYN